MRRARTQRRAGCSPRRRLIRSGVRPTHTRGTSGDTARCGALVKPPLSSLLSLSKRIYRAITEQGMFHAGERIGVAVSGGADSVALLRVLADLRQELGIGLAVLHFNHQLRGSESDDDEHFVASLAEGLGIELLSGRGDVAAAARERGWNLEDAARRLRYAFFSSVVAAGQVAKVAVAHTADDQAETVLARLVRGTGPSGLAAIYPVKGYVVRPLLETRRDALRAYLQR